MSEDTHAQVASDAGGCAEAASTWREYDDGSPDADEDDGMFAALCECFPRGKPVARARSGPRRRPKLPGVAVPTRTQPPPHQQDGVLLNQMGRVASRRSASSNPACGWTGQAREGYHVGAGVGAGAIYPWSRNPSR